MHMPVCVCVCVCVRACACVCVCVCQGVCLVESHEPDPNKTDKSGLGMRLVCARVCVSRMAGCRLCIGNRVHTYILWVSVHLVRRL